MASNGTLGNGPSVAPSVSTDGQYVAFDSRASNLIPDATNLTDDVFIHDRGDAGAYAH